MSDFITLACPSCGGNLAVTPDSERFACPYCRREHLVRRSGGHVSLVPIMERLERITEGVDRHASELAIQRLRKDRRAVKERINKQKDRIGDGRRALSRVEAELAGTRTQSIVLLALAAATGGGALGIFLFGRTGFACFGVPLLLIGAVCGLTGLSARFRIGRRIERIGQIRRSLDKDYEYLDELKDELDRIDEELDHHERVVSI
jgi:hypothetical protein